MTDIHARMLAKPAFVVTRIKKNGITHPTRPGNRTISQWSSTKAKQVLKSLKSIGWKIKRQTSSHKILERSGCNDVVFAFHDGDDSNNC